MPRRTARRGLPGLRALGLALVLAGTAAAAAPLKLGLLVRADDPRLEPRRVERAYPGHPGGPAAQAVQVALDESRFELEAAKLEPSLDTVEVADAAAARAALQALEKAGAVAVIADLPATWLQGLPAATKLPLLNAGAADDGLRAVCAANLFHTLPSERMRADALAQHLLARRWQRVLLLQGSGADDVARGAVAQASLKRFGLRAVASRPWTLSADPRERELANVTLLTQQPEHDVVWVVDSDGEFARTLPYRTAQPRPVVGDGGLFAAAWAPQFERFGAPQLARRFARAAKRPMTAHDWAAWMAAKAVLQAAVAAPKAVLATLQRQDFVLDGFKGTRSSFRAWDRQLRQPLLLSDGVATVGSAPVDGVLHPRNVLDTLGADAPESPCPAR